MALSYVQALSPGNTGAVAASSISQAATITAGSIVFVGVYWDVGFGGGPITGVSDSSGSYTAPSGNSPATTPDGQKVAWFYKLNHPGGSVTITATLGFSAEYRNILVVEYSGSYGVFHKFSANASTNSGTAPDGATSGSQTTTVANTEVIGAYWRIIGSGNVVNPGTGFAFGGLSGSTAPAGVWTEQRTLATAGAVAATWEQDVDNGYTSAMLVVEPAGGGGSIIPKIMHHRRMMQNA